MDDIIKRIIEVEERAGSFANETNDELQNIQNQLVKEEKEMKENIDIRVNNKIKQIIDREFLETSQKIDHINKKTINQLSDIIKTGENKEKEWEEQIINNIFGW